MDSDDNLKQGDADTSSASVAVPGGAVDSVSDVSNTPDDVDNPQQASSTGMSEQQEATDNSSHTQLQQHHRNSSDYPGEASVAVEQYDERAVSPDMPPRAEGGGSPECQPVLDLGAERLFSGNENFTEVSGSASSDLEHFYRLSAERFNSEGHEASLHPHSDSHSYDDLPLMFSAPGMGGEDESSKVYSCHMCNFRTAFKNSLVNHQAVHSDIRPWVCDVCDYAAKRKQDLKKHLQTMHGMVIDSFQLRPGINPSALSLTISDSVLPSSSGGLSSPVDTKPVIVGNAVVSGDQCSNNGSSYSPRSGMPSQNLTALSHTSAVSRQMLSGFGHLPAPSTQASQNPRSLAMPAVGKFIADKFPFNQYFSDQSRGGLPHFSADLWNGRNLDGSNRHSFESGTESESDKPEEEDAASDDQLSHASSLLGHRSSLSSRHADTQHRDQPRKSAMADSRNWLPSASETLSRDRSRTGFSSHGDARPADIAGYYSRTTCHNTNKSNGRLNAFNNLLAATVMIDSQEGAHALSSPKWKRPSSDSTEGSVPVKTSRFHSESDHSPLVSSQSGNAEPASSVVMRSRTVETDRNFHCEHCNIMFFDNALYLMHMGLHDNSNPWKCSVCGRTFCEKYSFTSHFINQH